MIPNIFHFIWFLPESGGKPFSLFHYIAIKSAFEINKPDKIFIYNNKPPDSEWWHKLSSMVEVVKTEPPQEIFDNKLYHLAHKADITRINVLRENGGIYMDLDTICKKPFTPLLKYKFVMGKQGRFRNMGLGNSVMLAEKNAEFLSIWIEEYKTFRSKGHDKYWGEHSIKKPGQLSKKYPQLIHIEPYDSFQYPIYYSFCLKKLFVRNLDFKNAYCHHLWENGSYDLYLKNLTVEEIKTKDTTYNVLARKFL